MANNLRILSKRCKKIAKNIVYGPLSNGICIYTPNITSQVYRVTFMAPKIFFSLQFFPQNTSQNSRYKPQRQHWASLKHAAEIVNAYPGYVLKIFPFSFRFVSQNTVSGGAYCTLRKETKRRKTYQETA